MQLLVLGMHRSGTSAVTRILNLAGAYFGPEGISNGADEGNPKGFWERVDVRAACDGLLQGSGFDWWKLSDFELDAIPDDVRARHLRELGKIVLGLDAHRPWVVKEPRLSLLFPLVRPLLEVPVCVHVVREPLEVAHSLRTRNDFPIPVGLALWELYTVYAFRATAGLPRVLVRYDELVGDPLGSVGRLVEALSGLGVDRLHLPSDAEITAFLTPDLHRERRSAEHRGGWLNERQASLAAGVESGRILDEESLPDVSEGALDTLRSFELQQAGRAQLESTRAELVASQQRVDTVQLELKTTTAALDERRSATERDVATGRAVADEQRRRVAAAEKALADAVKRRVLLEAKHERTLTAIAEDLRSLGRSRSWRLAAKLTSLSVRARRGKRQRTPLQRARSRVDGAIGDRTGNR